MPKKHKAKPKNPLLFPVSSTVIIASLILVILGYVNDNAALAAPKLNVYHDANITLNYPLWKAVDLTNNPYKENLPVAVSNGSCAFMLVTAPMPPGSTLKDFETATVAEQSSAAGAKVLKKTLAADSFVLETTVPTDNGALMRQYAYGVMGANHSVYQVTFYGPAKTFLKSCTPNIQPTVKSVVLLSPPSEQADALKFADYFKSFSLGKLALNKKVGPKSVPVKTTVFTGKDQFCVVADLKQDIPVGVLATALYSVETAQNVYEKSASTDVMNAGNTMSCNGPSKLALGRYEMKIYLDDVLAGVYPFTIKK